MHMNQGGGCIRRTKQTLGLHHISPSHPQEVRPLSLVQSMIVAVYCTSLAMSEVAAVRDQDHHKFDIDFPVAVAVAVVAASAVLVVRK